MKSRLVFGVIIMMLCTVFTSLGQFFFKKSSAVFSFSLEGLVFNYLLIIGLAFYGVGAFLLMVALKFGDLSVIYPLVSLTLIWVLMISAFFFNEAINQFKIGAVIFIIIGIVLIVGSNHG